MINYQLPITNYELSCENSTNSIEYTQFAKLFRGLVLTIFILTSAACDLIARPNKSEIKSPPKITSKILYFNEHAIKYVDYEKNEVVKYNIFDITDEFPKNSNISSVTNKLLEEGFKEMLPNELDEMARLKTNKVFLEGKIYSKTYHDGPVTDCKTHKIFLYVSLFSNENQTLKQAYGMSPFIFPSACGSEVR